MKKIEILSLFVMLLGLKVIAQSNPNYSGKIVFEEIYKNPDLKINQKTLYFDSDQSYFEWFDKTQKVKTLGDGTTIYPNNTKISIAKFSRFQLHRRYNKEFYIRLFSNNKERLIKNTYYNFEWRLLDETKKIDRFICQKAKTEYKGRSYIAWFTNDIPVPFGPGRFHGLGGMILELYEENGLLHLQAKTVSVNTETINIEQKIENIDFSKFVTESEYDSIAAKELKDFESRLNALRSKGQKPIRFNNRNCKDCGERLDKQKNNEKEN